MDGCDQELQVLDKFRVPVLGRIAWKLVMSWVWTNQARTQKGEPYKDSSIKELILPGSLSNLEQLCGLLYVYWSWFMDQEK